MGKAALSKATKKSFPADRHTQSLIPGQFVFEKSFRLTSTFDWVETSQQFKRWTPRCLNHFPPNSIKAPPLGVSSSNFPSAKFTYLPAQLSWELSFVKREKFYPPPPPLVQGTDLGWGRRCCSLFIHRACSTNLAELGTMKVGDVGKEIMADDDPR